MWIPIRGRYAADRPVAAALAAASLSKWRMELRDLAGGATLLNDSYNANPGVCACWL